MYIAESSKVLRRALAAGHQPRSFFLAEKWLEDLDDVFRAHPDVPVFIGKASLLEEITGVPPAPRSHGCNAPAGSRPVVGPLGQRAADRRPGGHRGPYQRGCHLPLCRCTWSGRGPRVATVRGTAVQAQCSRQYGHGVPGSWARLESWPGDLAQLKEQGFTVAAMELTDDALDLDDLAARNIPPKLALVLGTEGAGMSWRR